MYNVKGPSKIVAKTTRRGITQNIDTFSRDHSKNKSSDIDNDFNGPKPIFHNTSRRYNSHQKQQEDITPHHQEIIKYIHESWRTACSEIQQNCGVSDCNGNPDNEYIGEHSTLYYEDDPCPHLQDFKPFDLESWWGKRLYTHITNSVSTKP